MHSLVRSLLSSTCCGCSWWDVSHIAYWQYGPKKNSGERVLRDYLSCLACLVSSRGGDRYPQHQVHTHIYTHTLLTNRRPVRWENEEARQAEKSEEKRSGVEWNCYHRPTVAVILWLLSSSSLLLVPPVAKRNTYCASPWQCFKLLLLPQTVGRK